MKREVQDGPRTDVRYVAEIHLPTGKMLSIESEWMPSHWDLVDLRRGVIGKARERARGIRREAGVSADVIKVHCERRTIEPPAHDEACEADWGPEGQESPCRCGEWRPSDSCPHENFTSLHSGLGMVRMTCHDCGETVEAISATAQDDIEERSTR